MKLSKNPLILTLIFVAAVGVRIISLLEVRDLPFYYHPIMDSGFFHQWALFKAGGNWADLSTPFREPGYAYFMALVYKLFPGSVLAVRILQSVLSGLTVVFAYKIASRLFDQLSALITSIILILCSLLIFFTLEMNETTFVLFLLVIGAYFLLKASDSKTPLYIFASGLLLGAAFVARFTIVIVGIAWLIYLLTRPSRKLRAGAALFIIGAALLPALYQVFLVENGERSLLPARSGWQAYLSSSATGEVAKYPFMEINVTGCEGVGKAHVATDWTDGERDALRLAKVESGKQLGPRQACRHWHKKNLDEFLADPGRYLSHYLRKLGTFWGRSLPPANIDSRYVARFSLMLRNPLFSFIVVVSLGFVGMIIFGARQGALSVTIVVYSLAASLFFVSDAEKAIVIPFLAVFGGALVASIYRNLASMEWTGAFAQIGFVALIAIVVFLLPGIPLDEARHLVITGDIYSRESIIDESEESYKRALEISPESPDAYLSLSKLYATTGKVDQAIATLGRAIQQGVRDPRIYIEKASLLVVNKQPQLALGEIEKVEVVYPFEPRLHETKGLALLSLGKYEEAVRELQKEVQIGHPTPVTLTSLGKANLALGKYEEAEKWFRSVVDKNPYDAYAVSGLVDACAKLGKHEEAINALANVLRVDPGNIKLRFKLANELYRAGKLNSALHHYKELHKFYPKNVDFLLNMGVVYAEMDSLDRAIEMWKKVLELDPQNELARENLRKALE